MKLRVHETFKDPKKIIDRLDLSDPQKRIVETIWEQIDITQKKAERNLIADILISVLTIASSIIVSFLVNFFFVSGTSNTSQVWLLSIGAISLLVPVLILLDKTFRFGNRGKEYNQLNEALIDEFWKFILMEGPYKKYPGHREAFAIFLEKDENIIRQRTQQRASSPTFLETKADSEQEIAVQSYFDRMVEFLVTKNLRTAKEMDEVRKVARVITLTTLRNLDGSHKGSVIEFLYKADLLSNKEPIIDLTGADLSGLELSRSHLSKVNLSAADLSKANLNEGNLAGAYFEGTNLSRANLSNANLIGANLSNANLTEASLRGAQLTQANLDGADLNGADLSKAILDNSNLTDTQIGSTASNKT